MPDIGANEVTYIVLTIVFFMLFGIALLVIIDHKAKIPGAFHNDPFSISGLRRGHPVISFLTATILGVIILALLFEIAVASFEFLGIGKEPEQPGLLQELNEQRFTERMRHFHNEPVEDLVTAGKKTVCFYCHGDFPHAKQRMVRTLLNMHTQFIGCMTCHTDPDKIPQDSYRFRWLNYSGIDTKGPPFGTSLDPKTGFLVGTDNYFSKIVVYTASGDEEQLLEVPELFGKGEEFLSIREQLSEQDRNALKKRFHALTMPKGRACARCHTTEEKSYLPFRDLGFSDQRVADLTNLNMVGIVDKYREFYLPRLFDSAEPQGNPGEEKLDKQPSGSPDADQPPGK